jgi:hypothetical protein
MTANQGANMKQEYRMVKNYKINIDYDIRDFGNFEDDNPLIGIENELKVSNTEALNYLMGFPLDCELKSLVERLPNNYSSVISKENLKEYNNFHLKWGFDKKKKLISKNFESTTHIDVQEFLAWAERKNFITLK